MPPTSKQNVFAQQKMEIYNDSLFCWRERITAAQVNAGYTILNAINNYKYRIISAAMIAIGGAAAGATDVRVSGTQGAAALSPMIAPVAALTQNALVSQQTATVTIPNGGAGFDVLDANTPVTVGKTGGSLTGATAIDVIIQYAIVRA